MHKVLSDAGTLRLPVTPDSHGTVVNVVPAEYNVDSRMEFHTRYLGSAQLLHIIDMVDVVILYYAEHAAHASDNSGLLTVVDVAAADNMAPHFLLEPAVVLSAADSVTLHLSGALDVLARKVVVVLRVVILAQGYAAALAVADIAVLNYPAL